MGPVGMRSRRWWLRTIACSGVSCTTLTLAQSDAEYASVLDPPRLLLRPQRLRLLRRERERQSPRYQQLERFMAGGAAMPEPGFAGALWHQVTQDRAAGLKAVQWALGASVGDLRQVALVADWCDALLTDANRTALGRKLLALADATAQRTDLPALRSRALAALVLTDREPQRSAALLRGAVEGAWKGHWASQLQAGTATMTPIDQYALLEFLHVVRDNLNVDLRDPLPGWFQEWPARQVLSYYPARLAAPENDYRVPMQAGSSEPDLRVAALSRAAELSMVAYESNGTESQFLQGWLMNDRFQLQSPYGAPYEYLWANPYQPGLSYTHLPLAYHDQRSGRLWLRSSWDEEAEWFHYAGRGAQFFREGEIRAATLASLPRPLQIADSVVLVATEPLRFAAVPDGVDRAYVVGLRPSTAYQVEVDDQELEERKSDRGGILALRFGKGLRSAFRLKPA